MIKRLIDGLRGCKGYAGMAVYGGETILFREGIAAEYLARVRCLKARKATVVANGYTISMFEAGGFLVICRFEGRFTPLPGLAGEELEYMAGPHEATLIAREAAAKEAALMLKRLMSIE